MYIIAIGWLYVVLMMALTSGSFMAGLLTFLGYGLAPVALLLWILGTPSRRKRRALPEPSVHVPHQPLHAGDRADPQRDQ